MNENKTAYIYNEGRYTKIRIKDRVITIIAPGSLERYIAVKKWDYGYIEVMTKYAHDDELIEEYIDLIPILEELYMDPEEILGGVDNLEVCYKSPVEWDGWKEVC